MVSPRLTIYSEYGIVVATPSMHRPLTFSARFALASISNFAVFVSVGLYVPILSTATFRRGLFRPIVARLFITS